MRTTEGAYPPDTATPNATVEMLEILVEGDGLAVAEIVMVARGGALRTVLEIVARKAGYDAAEAMVFLEGEGAPLPPDTVLDHTHPHHRKHHVHRLHEIEVVVHYSRNVERCYPPSTRVETVLAWAVKELGIDAAMAAEFELAVFGSDVEVPGSRHVGSLVKYPARRLDLNLVRGVIPNGFPL